MKRFLSAEIFLVMLSDMTGITAAACECQKAVLVDVVKTVIVAPEDHIAAPSQRPPEGIYLCLIV